MGVNVWINTAATPGALNVPGDKAFLRNALPHEPQPICIS